MSLVKKSVEKMNCVFSGHEISEQEEDRLYIKPTNNDGIRKIQSVCSRCSIQVTVNVDPTDEDQYDIIVN